MLALHKGKFIDLSVLVMTKLLTYNSKLHFSLFYLTCLETIIEMSLLEEEIDLEIFDSS